MIIWALTGDQRLSDAAQKLILSPDNTIYYSAASLWEIAIKNQKAPARCPYEEIEIERYCESAGFLPINISAEHVLAIRKLHPKEGHYLSNYDPFDRILLSQAKIEECRFLTHDTQIANYDESCIMLV